MFETVTVSGLCAICGDVLRSRAALVSAGCPMGTHCLLIGHHDQDFSAQVDLARRMGVRSGAHSDLRLAYFTHGGRPLRAFDAANLLGTGAGPVAGRRLDNFDFLSPAIHQIGSYLAQRGHGFDYLNLFHAERHRLPEKLAAWPACVCITTTYHVSPEPIREMTAAIRALTADIPIVAGGPFIHGRARMMTDQELAPLLRALEIDIAVVSRDGEETLVRLLEALAAGEDLDGVPNSVLDRWGWRPASQRGESGDH